METALITGASSGIGYELAKIHASKGHRVIAIARRTELLEKLKAECAQAGKGEIVVWTMDLAQQDAIHSIMHRLEAENMEVDFLVNNAGFGTFGLLADTDAVQTEEMLRLNIISLTALTHAILPKMLGRGKGYIMNIASTAAFQPVPLMAAYAASKSYVLHFSEALANEVRGTGVSITALCPGVTESGFKEAAKMENSGLFKRRGIPSSYEVAQFAYKAMHQKKTLAIHGWINSFLARSAGFFPRYLQVLIARKVAEQ
jgi:short-subunit dehydrogenase